VDGSGIPRRSIAAAAAFLACPSEGRWVFAVVVITDPLVDVAGPTSGRTTIVAACEILLERRALLQHLLSLFLKFSLKLLKLL
jgi:hypothetical protein